MQQQATGNRLSLAEIEVLPLRQVQNVQQLLLNKNAVQELGRVAAHLITPDRMLRVVANAIRTTPKLGQCEPMSLMSCLMVCSSLGLEPNTPLGMAYLIPFNNSRKKIIECQLVIGYKGFCDLARRSGQVESIHADVHYDDDELWSYEYGSEAMLRHKPGPRNGKKVSAYCHVRLKDGGQAFVNLPWDHIMRVRNASQNWKSAVQYGKEKDTPWALHEDRMAAKTAVRALMNSGEVPLSIQLMDAIMRDDGVGAGMGDMFGDVIDGSLHQDGADGDGNMIEGEADQSRGARAPDPEPERKPVAKKEAGPEPEKAAAPKPEPEKKAPVAAAEKAGNTPQPDQKQRALAKIYDMVVNDAADAASIDAVKELHADALDDMLRFAPAMHRRLMTELDDFAARPEPDDEAARPDLFGGSK